MTATDAAPPRPDALALAMGVGFAIMWSSAFTSAKIVVADAPPFLALALRFALSGLLAVALAAALGQTVRLGRRGWALVVVFGICQNALYLGLNFLAMTRIEGGLAAIIASLLPLLVAAGSWAVFAERPGRLGGAGLALGFAGVAVVMANRLEGGTDALGVGLCVVAALALSVATLALRGMTAGGNLLMIVGLQMLVGAVALAPVTLLFEDPSTVTWSMPLGLAFAYTTLVPGLAATLVWFMLVRRIGPTRASSFHFLNPALGVGIAALILAEPFGWRDAAGVAVTTVGILMVQSSRRRV
ncbi:MAG: DMT family transporter [Paracoccaceae bacterium]